MDITFGGILYDPVAGTQTSLVTAPLPVKVDPSHNCYSLVELYFNLNGSSIALYASVYYLKPDSTQGPSKGLYLFQNGYIICYNYSFDVPGIWKVNGTLGDSMMKSWNVFDVGGGSGFSDLVIKSYARV